MPPVIRPFTPPTVTPNAPARPPPEARAAQRAFFQQALGDATPVRTAPQAQAATPARAAEAPVARAITRPIPEEPPQRMLRPGSFVDIKV